MRSMKVQRLLFGLGAGVSFCYSAAGERQADAGGKLNRCG